MESKRDKKENWKLVIKMILTDRILSVERICEKVHNDGSGKKWHDELKLLREALVEYEKMCVEHEVMHDAKKNYATLKFNEMTDKGFKWDAKPD